MSDPMTEDAVVTDAGSSAVEPKPRIDWADPSIPVGNAPPRPKWPLVLLAVLWLAGIVFLALMAVSRGGGTAV